MPKNLKEFKMAPEPSFDPAVNEVITIMDKWFWDLEDGKTNNRFPSPHGLQVTMDEADEVIAYIDREINDEVTRHTDFFWAARGMDTPADFNRLKGVARIAFAQEILQAKKRLGLERKCHKPYPVATTPLYG